jgi:oligopeptide/dipeptide ABC transporter ATP-binding protein
MSDAGSASTNGEPLESGTVIKVHDLQVHFQGKAGVVEAVDGVNFEVRAGETLGLVGETGCGKSVTARSFLGLVPSPPALPPRGSIHFRYRGDGGNESAGGSSDRSASTDDGEVVDLLNVDRRRMGVIRGNRIAMIFQDPGKALNPALTVRDQLGEVFLIHRSNEVMAGAGVDPGANDISSRLLKRAAGLRATWIEKLLMMIPPLRARRQALLASVDSLVVGALAETQIPNPTNILDRYPHELSGGMKQRVMIAQALACKPDVLIADEPTTALDVTVQARIVELIGELQRRHNTSVLYISHDLSLVRRICDRIAVMYAGRIAEIGSADEVFHQPRHPYTRGLLAAIPSMASERGRLEAIEGTVPELLDPEPGCRFADRCRHVTEMCRSANPVLVEIDPGHAVSCFAYEPLADSELSTPTVPDRHPATIAPGAAS